MFNQFLRSMMFYLKEKTAVVEEPPLMNSEPYTKLLNSREYTGELFLYDHYLCKFVSGK